MPLLHMTVKHPFASILCRLLNAITSVKVPQLQNTLMYVETKINGGKVLALVDSGASHNFMTEREARRLDLAVKAYNSKIKAVNSEEE